MRVAHVVVDVPTRALETPFDYLVPDDLVDIGIGTAVLVDFANRAAVGYVVGLTDESPHARLKQLVAVVGGPFFSAESAETAQWIAKEYLCPLSEAIRLFTPPGGTPKAVRDENGAWVLRRPGVGPVDDRWAQLTDAADLPQLRPNATMQRAVLDALSAGPVRVAELAADLGSVDGALKSLCKLGVVTVDRRRRMRDALLREKAAPRHSRLSDGQLAALEVIDVALRGGGGRVALDGVTGSGKTEVYLRAIERVVESGRSAAVLVPEISLTPQTVGRFRARFGDLVAVLHSRLSAGERFDQWDRIRRGEARIVVGARSALFAPLSGLGLIIIDEEHESSYKQGSSPRYHARDVAAQLAARHCAVLVVGSASLSLEVRHLADLGEYRLVRMPERVTGRDLPDVHIVDMAGEFTDGHRSMFSRPLIEALQKTRAAGDKAVLFLNRRGFASFVLCRECGHVPACDSCAVSLTFHDVGSRLMCHHCGSRRPLPAKCPSCGSPYLRQFGAGTQRVEAELEALLPGWPVVRMDADTTKGKGAHERLLASFEALESGVLLGTQMIAKGLDYPEVTLVGIISADVTLNLPDFRAPERTYQLLEQVSGRAGRGARAGNVYLQTYWPEHPAIIAAAHHNPEPFYAEERAARRALNYPPFGRLANVLIWGADGATVEKQAEAAAALIRSSGKGTWTVMGPSPAPLSRLKGVWRWHVLVKAPEGFPLPQALSSVLAGLKPVRDVSVITDIDALDLL